MAEPVPVPADPPQFAVADAVQRALAEDLTPLGDLTSALLPPDQTASAVFVSRADGVLAGRACAVEAFRQIDPSLEIAWSAVDGGRVRPGSEIATVRGRLAPILTAERTALNFLGHLSGIATLTREFVERAHRASGGRTRVWDTRKTTPGLRSLEKAAVRAGGGANHRGNLSDWVLVKDNHVALLGIVEAAARARAMWPGRMVHVECDAVEQVRVALDAGVDAILLDNMAIPEIEKCVALARKAERRPLLEVSGGVTLDTIATFAATGVDLISVGALTNSAPVLDIGLDIVI
ncbi:MAG: carboxylating nicotinate-nucleotide diphosphorylase [Actinobacteria bacterium]|nr:carboxylating nicotinate-nucleotide diphosphorylase [Actinomycetota bacterium]